MEQKVWKILMKFSDIKRKAMQLSSIEDLKKLIAKTDYPSGDVAEIVMCFMLGNLCRAYDDGLRVFVSASSDRDGVDFCLRRFKRNYYIQLMWNKKNDRVYPGHITVVEVGAGMSFSGERYLPKMNGRRALYEVLVNSIAYDEDEFYDIEDNYPDFMDMCDEAWNLIKN